VQVNNRNGSSSRKQLFWTSVLEGGKWWVQVFFVLVPEKGSRYPLNRKLSGPHIRSGPFGEKNLSAPSWIELHTPCFPSSTLVKITTKLIGILLVYLNVQKYVYTKQARQMPCDISKLLAWAFFLTGNISCRMCPMFVTQLHESTLLASSWHSSTQYRSCRHVHDTTTQKHVIPTYSWHSSTQSTSCRHVHDTTPHKHFIGKFMAQLHTKPLSFLSLLVYNSSNSNWEPVRLYGKGFRYCPKQNGKSHITCGLRTPNGKVEEIKKLFATLRWDKSSIF
jgi:hypothetical protein